MCMICFYGMYVASSSSDGTLQPSPLGSLRELYLRPLDESGSIERDKLARLTSLTRFLDLEVS